MPFTFNTREGLASTLTMVVKMVDPNCVFTAEFTSHRDSDPVIFTGSLVPDGNSLVLYLTSDQVNLIKDAYFRIKATKGQNSYYIDSGKIKFNRVPATAKVQGDTLILIDPLGREYNAGSVRGPQGVQGPQGETGGVTAEELAAVVQTHVNNTAPHPVYDDLPSLILLFENGLM